MSPDSMTIGPARSGDRLCSYLGCHKADAWHAAPLLLSHVAALHALRRLWHGYNGCAKVLMRC